MKTSTLLFTLTLAATAFCTPTVIQRDDQGSDDDFQATGLGSHEIGPEVIGPEIGEPIDWDLGDAGGPGAANPTVETMPPFTPSGEDDGDGDETDPDGQVFPFGIGPEITTTADDPIVGEDGPVAGGVDPSDGSASIQVEPLGVGATVAPEAGLGSVHVPPIVNSLLPPLHPTVRKSSTTKVTKPTTKTTKSTAKTTKTTAKSSKTTAKSSSTKSKDGHPITRTSSHKSSSTESLAGHPITRTSSHKSSSHKSSSHKSSSHKSSSHKSSSHKSTSTKSKAGNPITRTSTHKTTVGHPITKSATTKHAACTTTTTKTLARLTKSPFFEACEFDGTERLYPGTTTKTAYANCHGCSKIVTEYKPSFIHCPAEVVTATVTEKKLFTTTRTVCKPSQTK